MDSQYPAVFIVTVCRWTTSLSHINWSGFGRLSIGGLIVAAILGGIAIGQPPTKSFDQSETDIRTAIRLLGDPDSTVREKARQQLLKIGTPAIDLLQQAAELRLELDHEVQSQAVEILEDLSALATEMRTKKFIAGQGTLPGWQQFNVLCDDSPLSREFYRRMFVKHQQRIEIALQNQFNFDADVSKLLGSSQPEDLAIVLFSLVIQETNTPLPSHTQLLSSRFRTLVSQFRRHPSLSQKQKYYPVVAKIVCAFVETSGKLQFSDKLDLLAKVSSPSADDILIKWTTATNPLAVRALAIAGLSPSPSPEVVAQLDPLLKDSAEVGTFLLPKTVVSNVKSPAETSFPDTKASSSSKMNRIEVQIRDLALLVRLTAAGQLPSDYGFAEGAVSGKLKKIDIRKSGFVSNQNRNIAFQKWQEFISTTGDD